MKLIKYKSLGYWKSESKIVYKILTNKKYSLGFMKDRQWIKTEFESIDALLTALNQPYKTPMETVQNTKQPKYEVIEKFDNLQELKSKYAEYMI
jgi:hypothetical protein